MVGVLATGDAGQAVPFPTRSEEASVVSDDLVCDKAAEAFMAETADFSSLAMDRGRGDEDAGESESRGIPEGDVNGDGNRDGRDIQPFIGIILENPKCGPCQSPTPCCRADINNDNIVDLDDVPLFTAELLAPP